MSHKRELFDDVNGPTCLELSANALNFTVVMKQRNGVLVELSTPGGPDSEEARLIDTARLERARVGFKLVVDVPGSVTMLGSRSGGHNVVNNNYGSVGMQVGTVYGNVQIGNVQYNSFSGGSYGGGLVLEHGIDVTVYLPQDSDVIASRGGNLEVFGYAGLIETDLSGGNVFFEQASKVDIHTDGGGVNGDLVAGRAKVRTSGGTISINTTRGEIDLKTSGGNVRVGEAYYDGEMRTSGGNVELGLFHGKRMIMRTSGGDIRHPEHPGIQARTSGGRINGRW